MLGNLIALIKACEKTGVDYKFLDSYQRIVEVFINGRSYLFIKGVTPLNPHSVVYFCKDKDYFYKVFQNAINMPHTHAFLDPNCEPPYAAVVKEKTLEEIVNAIEANFSYPAIIKKNSGSMGKNIFQISNRSESKAALKAIFDVNHKEYDRIALAQEYIHIKKEYRAVYLNASLCFAYEKNIDRAEFQGNLSPLHWEGAKAIVMEDESLLSQINQFCIPIFRQMMIPFCGLDLVLDYDNKWWLIEANSCPTFLKVIADGGEHKLIEMYEKILAFLSNA